MLKMGNILINYVILQFNKMKKDNYIVIFKDMNFNYFLYVYVFL